MLNKRTFCATSLSQPILLLIFFVFNTTKVRKTKLSYLLLIKLIKSISYTLGIQTNSKCFNPLKPRLRRDKTRFRDIKVPEKILKTFILLSKSLLNKITSFLHGFWGELRWWRTKLYTILIWQCFLV